MSTASISIGAPRPNIRLDDLKTDFRTAGADQHLRFSEAKGLHTHSRFGASMVDFLAKFRNAGALQERAELRQGAIKHVKTAIDNQFGKGMGERVFAEATERGMISAGGVTKTDLGHLDNVARELRASDNAKAETTLGRTIAETLIDARDSTGCSMAHLDKTTMAELGDAIADAINALPKPVARADADRVAQGVVLKSELLHLARAATDANPAMGKTGLNGSETTVFNGVMDSFFKPGGANTGTDVRTVRDVLLPILGRASSPSLDQVNMNVTRLAAQRLPLEDRAADIRDFITRLANPSGEKIGQDGSKHTKSGLEDGGVASFMRSNPVKPGDAGFTSFAIIRGSAEGSVKPSFDPAVNVMKGLAKFEYRDEQLKTLPPEQQRQVAQDSVHAFDQVMTHVFGGKGGTAIDGAVGKLSQEFCDLLATAHDTLDREARLNLSQETIDKAPGSTPTEKRDNAEKAARESLHKKLDVNFFALRVINPMLTDAGIASPKDNAKLVNVSKLVQDAANGVDPTTKGKEAVHPSIAGQLQQTASEWGDAYATFMDKARARGTVID